MNLTAQQLRLRFEYLSHDLNYLSDKDVLLLGQKAFNECNSEVGSEAFNQEFANRFDVLSFTESRSKTKE